MARWALRIGDLLFGLLFVYAAYVNLNDADWYLWGPIYLVGAAFAVADAVDRLDWRAAAGTALAYGLGALAVASQGISDSHPMKGFPQYGVFREEIVRESLGLGLVAVWVAVLAVARRRAA